jgi:ubiquinol-cytochrome c reductase cytochrome c1 subunit
VKTAAILCASLWIGILSARAQAEGAHDCGQIECDRVLIDLDDKPSLQRGARTFVNYCLSCHSASYMRYNRMGRDLGISEELVKENLLFAADKVGDLMKAVMRKEDAKLWFGVAPPDLTVEARARNPEWIYTYLRSFYRDERSHSGWNNLVFANVAMPHALYEWQGEQRPVYRAVSEKLLLERDGKTVETTVQMQVFDHLELAKPGTKTPAEYNRDMSDLTNFLVYLGEPAKLDRYRIGIYVLIFLAVFLFFAYLLKKEYWKDVH